ncbi:hypothetical protein DH2020_013568 [Rehmannia glutinosa]|uniref:Uncharacterized protein n=1 Tax=Rehmannia glutinosa TaxID=99300 RepID=A0ABR0X5R9_REHGL
MATKKSQEDQRAGAEIVHGPDDCYDHSLKLLTELGFPRGVLPLKDLEECGLVRREVTVTWEKGKMKKMSGVKSKQLLLWVPIVEMSIEESGGGKIYFKTPMGIGRSFPITSFMDDEEKEKHLEEVNE